MNMKVDMGKLSTELRLSLLLAAVCAGLGLLLVVEWYSVDRMHRVPQVTKAADKAVADEPDLAPFEFPDLGEFEELVERPLFVEGRRPPPEVVEEPPPPVSRTPLDLKLMGMIFSPTGKTALLVDPKGKYKRVKEGGVVGGWLLKELKTDRVLMQQDGETKELPLLKAKPKVGAGGAPQPPAEAKPGKKPPPGLQPPDAEIPDEEDGEMAEPDEDIESDGAEDTEDQSDE
jgi:type II secretory pathway component PulC